MDEETVKLYGYKTEKDQIDSAVKEKETLHFLCLHGRGGIGKTTMLRTVHEEYQRNEDYRITDLLDFDNLRLHILQNVLDVIATQLCTVEAPFAGYNQAAARLREIQHKGVSRLRIEDQEKRVRDAFIQDYRALAPQQRCILLFDTVEKVQNSKLWQELVQLLLQLENTAVLLAGRNNDKVGEQLQKKLKPPNSAQVIPLQGLSYDESLEYFKRTKLGQFLAQEDVKQTDVVCRLSAGRPILLDLAVDWLGQGIQLKVSDQVLDKLDESALSDMQRQFERRLVEKVKDLGEPRNEAILEIAHIYHYFDAERYRCLHEDVSPEKAQALMDELSNFSFIKPQPGGGIRLHDEMQRMVNEYVWPVLDRNRNRRRWLSECMIQFYKARLAEHAEDPVVWQALAAEQLHHRLYADIKAGHRAFEQIFRQALTRNQIDFAHLLFTTLDEFADDFDPELKAWAQVHRGRLLRAEEKVQDAVNFIQPAKVELQELCVREELDTVCNALGYAYRLLGNWQQAIAAYEEALAYSREEQDARQIAETMNNIANTCRLSGDFEKANRYSLMSLKIRERLGDKRAIGNSCYVRGMICWETGNTAEAADYARRARRLFTEIDDLLGIAEVGRFESYLHFRTADLDEALRLLEQPRRIFEEQGYGLGLAEALNLEARIWIDKVAAERETEEDLRKIEILTQQALSVAQRIRDYYKIAECRLTLCRLYYRWERYLRDQGDEARARDYRQKAREQYDSEEGGRSAQQRDYKALWSVYEWAMGDLAFDAHDWKTAFDHYLQECATAAHFKDARFARALNGLSERLHRLSSDEDGSRELTRQYCDYAIGEWKARGLASDFPELIDECEHIKTFLGLVDPQHLDQLRQVVADMLTRGEWQGAVDVYQELLSALLSASQTQALNEQVAWAMNQGAWAYRQMGDFVRARRLCQQGRLIRLRLKDEASIASSLMVMGSIMWPTGNTEEAARYLRLSRQRFEKAQDEVGLARANLRTAFLYFRIGDHEKARYHLDQAERTFRAQELHADLADTLNMYARVLRAEGRYDQAHARGEESRYLAQKNGAHHTLAEAWLTLGLIKYELGREALKSGNIEVARQHFEQAKALHWNGYSIAEKYGYQLLLSVYENLAAVTAFEEERYADAFEHFLRDLEFGFRHERPRLRRELDRIVDCLAQLPDGLRRFYADYMITEWQNRGLAEPAPDVPRMLQLLKEYSQYV